MTLERKPAVLLLWLHCLPLLVHSFAGFTDDWRSASIYQLLTDRFATDISSSACDLRGYCGGTFAGIQSKAAYIKQLGFDAVWISPVVENTQGGYHGYWAKNFSNINPKFGTAAELTEMVEALHRIGLTVMVDAVANHVGYATEPFDQVYPFNKTEFYHDCTDCDGDCSIPGSAWELKSDFDQHQIEHCRVAGLPDLDQDHPVVRQLLLDWIRDLVKRYKFDGVRLDTVPEVKMEFWKEFVTASGVFVTGEVLHGDPAYVGPYQQVLPSVLSYPMYFTLKDVFGFQKPMWQLHDRREQHKQFFQDPSALASFIDNHDNPRFLSFQRDKVLYWNALAWVLLSEGIPIVYYGSEAGFNGGADPDNREPLWSGGYNTTHSSFKFIQALNSHRKQYQVWQHPHQEVHYEEGCYVFTRGRLLVALTNVGSNTERFKCQFAVPPGWSGSVQPVDTTLPKGQLTRFWQGDNHVAVGDKHVAVGNKHVAVVTFSQGAPALFILGSSTSASW